MKKRMIWNVKPELDFACIGYMDTQQQYVWKEVVRILYFKKENLRCHLTIRGELIGKYNYTWQARMAAESICLQ